MPENQPNCLYCERTSTEVPLIGIVYRDQPFYICPQHLPILIHQPARLAGKLPGAENLSPTQEDHHG
jgi:hypothetical protein